MRFVDRVRISVEAGDGGDGRVAWRREAHTPRGGPAGGDGGDGGSVWFLADESLSTLLDLRYRQHYRAEAGAPGRGKDQNGRAGADLLVRVPVGTMVYLEAELDPAAPTSEPGPDPTGDGALENVWVIDVDHEVSHAELFGEPEEPAVAAKPEPEAGGAPVQPGELLGDLAAPAQRLLAAAGGRGGRGNRHFRSSTNQAPERAEPGTPGQARRLRLELKLLADVGIIGLPNVGKSTLIARISRARPRIADYPFTTLVPHLGVVSLDPERTMVVADVPGLVEGASEGRGLGHAFLRHLERTRVLLHLLAPDPAAGREPLADLELLERELSRYGPVFAGRPRVVALNKIDTAEGRGWLQDTRRALAARDVPLFTISARTGEGVEALVQALWRRLERVRRRER